MCFIFRQHNKRLNMKRNAYKILSVSTLFVRKKYGPTSYFHIFPLTQRMFLISYMQTWELCPLTSLDFSKWDFGVFQYINHFIKTKWGGMNKAKSQEIQPHIYKFWGKIWAGKNLVILITYSAPESFGLSFEYKVILNWSPNLCFSQQQVFRQKKEWQQVNLVPQVSQGGS